MPVFHREQVQHANIVAPSALAMLLLLIVPVHAANITLVTKHGINTPVVIRVTGLLDKSDQEKFQAVAASSTQALVFFGSKGGVVRMDLEIGRTIRYKGFTTAVADYETCSCHAL
jgi:hypothetical protein